ncbi:MAG TPA: hypothetical protein PLN04_07835, partial [Moraxellaceae bacterium]|nr:hypothetical protein [Moraxellaceae bacterium]
MKKLTLSSLTAAIALSAQGAVAGVALDPQAINLEPFQLVPLLGAQMIMDDNIYNLSANEVDSMIFVVSPSVSLSAQDRD